MASDIAVPGAGAPKPRDPGIYFGLDEELYHADPSCGSTNIKKLFYSPPSYWHDSWMNPRRKTKKDTTAQVRGHAMHKLLYEGLPSFDALYICGPRHDDDMTPGEKSASTKAFNIKARELLKTPLPADDYDQIVMANAMITRNPKLKDVFVNGIGEVSIFWVQNGVPCKARIDYLKARGCGDGKGVANQYEKPFPQACREAIANYRYDMQAAHYLRARSKVAKFVADGAVYGDHDAELLKKIAASKAFAWQWVFYQMQGAPITWSKILSPQNPMLEFAAQHVDKALQNYRENMDVFGEDMWLLIEDPDELYMADMPGWYGK